MNNIVGPSPPAGIRISSPSVDYSVTSFTQTGPLIAGGPISESFTLQNNGTDTGSQSVQWAAYVSSDSLTTISVGDKVIDAGTYDPQAPSQRPSRFTAHGQARMDRTT